MLMLKFCVGSSTFVVRGDDVQEVVPRVDLIPLQGVPPHIVGVLNYGGVPVLVVDFCMVMQQRPSRVALHSRIILVRGIHEGHAVLVGMLAENVTEVVDYEDGAFKDLELDHPEKPFLGRVCSQAHQLIQEVLADKFIEWNRHALLRLADNTLQID